jgi:hypothetical protein
VRVIRRNDTQLNDIHQNHETQNVAQQKHTQHNNIQYIDTRISTFCRVSFLLSVVQMNVMAAERWQKREDPKIEKVFLMF